MLHRSRKAEAASARWRARKRWLRQYMADNAHAYADEAARRRKAEMDWRLIDAMDEWNWNRREANRLAQLILAEKAARDMIPGLMPKP